MPSEHVVYYTVPAIQIILRKCVDLWQRFAATLGEKVQEGFSRVGRNGPDQSGFPQGQDAVTWARSERLPSGDPAEWL